ncbi:peptidylprolyl isomerase, partial [Paenibacillus sepulcri]|nr:peptidylprolyl isomerase [Paenibacillus sepulcri]
FMIQGGDPDGRGSGGPGYAIKGEFSQNGVQNGLLHERGVISMARAQDMDSAGSQFFIMVDANTGLDGAYAAFGKVTKGLETVDAIVSVPTDGSELAVTPPKMKKVTVDTKGVDYPEPETITP